MLPVISTRSSGAPMLTRRFASSSLCAKNKLRILKSTLEEYSDSRNRHRSKREKDLSEMRAFAKITANARAPRFPQKIRPDLRFHHDHERGANRSQRFSHRHDPVERKIKNPIGGLQSFAREPLACFRSGGNKNCPVGKLGS
jgi:hypothetical protein